VLKSKCKVGTYIVAYCAKWLLTKHLKEVHGLMVKNAKPRKLSTSKGGFQHQNHIKMNVHILGDAMVVQRKNDQKVINCVRVKTQRKWDKLVIIVEQCPPLLKPALVKASEQL
jgi:hypothetical protein